jgi:hypothetical protein
MTLNQIYFNFIDNQRSLLSLFKYDFSDLQINEEENSENNMMLNQGNLGNNFLEINPFSQMEEEVFSSSLPTGDNIMKIDSSIDTDNKTKILFEVNTLIPDPFLEYQINVIIRLMDINKEQKEKYYLETKEICDKIYLVRDKIMLKKNERRRHLKRKNGVFENKNKDESNETIKTGRKKKSDGTNRFHNKYSLDNLFNKAKNMINKSLIEFINILINKIYTKEKIKRMFLELNIEKKKSNSKLIKVIKDNQYNFIKDKKKSSDILKLFSLTIKEYLCNEISTKYTNLPSDYNEKVIKWILKDDKNKEISDFIFNKLKIEDWVDIFLYRKKLKDYFAFNSINQNSQKIIKENIIGIDYYFQEIYLDNKGNADKEYFHCFLLLIYNLRRYVMIKEKRNCQKK